MTSTFQIANGDWVLNASNGRPDLVSDKVKLRQDIQEMLTIDRQSNGFGCSLSTIIGKSDDPFAVRSMMQSNIRAGVAKLMQLQQYQLAQRPLNERVARIAQLIVSPTSMGGGQVPTGFAFQLSVMTQDQQTVAIGLAISPQGIV